MKFTFLFTALFSIIALNLWGQSTEPMSIYKSYGYVGGVRLDSINAKYAQVSITGGMRLLAGNLIKRFTFEYGQKWKDEKEVRVVDKDANVITFNSLSAAFNFFDFNGWDVFYVSPSDEGGSFILKKKP